jgi:protein phosphatase
MLKRYFTGLTDAGILRQVNQDDFYIDPEGRFGIVADGMGGHAGGQEASKIATNQIRACLEESWERDISSQQMLAAAISQANQGIIEDQRRHPERGDMGTTVVVVLFRQGQSWYAHLGDSRLYRLRNSHLAQITEDHTCIGRALKMGDITPEQAKNHPWRHVLFQCLGRAELPPAQVKPLDIQPGDRLLLCSDGLTEEVSEATIKELLDSPLSGEEIAAKLVATAKEAGGSDNITVVIVVEP